MGEPDGFKLNADTNVCECKAEYFYDNGKCNKCSNKCALCDNADTCVECKGENTKPSTCECIDGYV